MIPFISCSIFLYRPYPNCHASFCNVIFAGTPNVSGIARVMVLYATSVPLLAKRGSSIMQGSLLFAPATYFAINNTQITLKHALIFSLSAFICKTNGRYASFIIAKREERKSYRACSNSSKGGNVLAIREHAKGYSPTDLTRYTVDNSSSQSSNLSPW